MYFSPRFSKKRDGCLGTWICKMSGNSDFFFFLYVFYSLLFQTQKYQWESSSSPVVGEKCLSNSGGLLVRGGILIPSKLPLRGRQATDFEVLFMVIAQKKPSKIFSMGQWSRFLAFLNTSQAFCTCSSGTLGFPISFRCFGTFLPMSSVVFKACALLIEKAVCLPMKFHHSHSPPWKLWAQHL